MRPCTCDNVSGPVYTLDQCRRCWKWHYNRSYRLHHSGAGINGPDGLYNRCVHLEGYTGQEHSCSTCAGNVRIKSVHCGKHGICTIHKAVAGIRCCAQCSDYTPGSIGVNQGAGGIGDALLGTMAVAALKRDNPASQICFFVSPSAVPFVRLFDAADVVATHDYDEGKDEAPNPGSGLRQMNLGYNAEVRRKGREPRLARYCRNIGVSNPMLPKLLDAERLHGLETRYRNFVVLAPFCMYPDRDYPLMSWLGVERLLNAAGLPTVIIDSRSERCARFHSPKSIAAEADRVASVLVNAKATIANDSGMAHLSGILGKPTVVLCGQTDGDSIFASYPHVRCLHGHLPCRGCWWQPPYSDEHCKPRCPSLASISPSEIVAAVKQMTRLLEMTG